MEEPFYLIDMPSTPVSFARKFCCQLLNLSHFEI